MTNPTFRVKQYSIEIPSHLTTRTPDGNIGKFTLMRTRLTDEFEEWLIEHAPFYMISFMLPQPVLYIDSDEQRALLKLTWGI